MFIRPRTTNRREAWIATAFAFGVVVVSCLVWRIGHPTGGERSYLGRTKGAAAEVLSQVWSSACVEAASATHSEAPDLEKVLNSPLIWVWPSTDKRNPVPLIIKEGASFAELDVPDFGKPEMGIKMSLTTGPQDPFQSESVANALLSPFMAYVSNIGLVPVSPRAVFDKVGLQVNRERLAQLEKQYGPICFYRESRGYWVDVAFTFRGAPQRFRMNMTDYPTDYLLGILGPPGINDYSSYVAADPSHFAEPPWFRLPAADLPVGTGPPEPMRHQR